MFAIMIFILITIVVLYLLLLLILYLKQDQIVFVKQPLSNNIDLESGTSEVHFLHQGEQLSGWLIQRDHRPLLLYYGGNAEEVSVNLLTLQKQQQYSVLLLNYRGYGQSTGEPSETYLIADAVYVLDVITGQLQLDPHHHVFLMGRSLGSGVAVQVAAQRRVAGLILVTPYDTLYAVGQRKYPCFPVKYLVRHRFDSMSFAHNIYSPALFLMAEKDTLIPPEHALRLQAVWGGQTQQYMFVSALHHDIGRQTTFWPMVEAYILQHWSKKSV